MPAEKKVVKPVRVKKEIKAKAVKAAKPLKGVPLGPVKVAKVEKAKKAEKVVEAPVKLEKAQIKEAKVAEKPKKKTGKTPADKDTGSVDFQINNFSKKIASLAKHLKVHAHDFDSRRGLLIMVGKRRRLLNYVKKNEPERYETLAKSLKLKK